MFGLFFWHFQVAFFGFGAGVFLSFFFAFLGHRVLSDGSVVCCCEWGGGGLFSCGMHGVPIVDSIQWYLYSS